MRLIFALCALSVSLAVAQTPLRWDVDLARPQPANLDVWRGEAVTLSPRFISYGRAWQINSNAAVMLYWSTNQFATAPFATNGLISATETGRVSVTWQPACDVGATAYDYFIGVSEPSGLLYRARGTITMRASPGFVPSTAPLPVWDGWTNNYIYATYASLLASSNSLALALQAEASRAQQAEASAVATAQAALAASGTTWRAEWQAAAGSSADVVRVALSSGMAALTTSVQTAQATAKAAANTTATHTAQIAGLSGRTSVWNSALQPEALTALDLTLTGTFTARSDSDNAVTTPLYLRNEGIQGSGSAIAWVGGVQEYGRVWARKQYPGISFGTNGIAWGTVGPNGYIGSGASLSNITAAQVGAISNTPAGLAAAGGITAPTVTNIASAIVAAYAAPSFPLYDYGLRTNVVFVLSNSVLYLYER